MLNILANIWPFCTKKNTKNINRKKLLLVRLDEIGDYVLFRNFIEILKTSEQYKDYHFTLLGNDLWKDLAETFDKDYIDEFIWLKKKRFFRQKFYRKNFLKKISKQEFDVVISPVFSRESCCESVISAINAREKIGSVGDCSNITAMQKSFNNNFYTKLIDASKDNMFEFYRNKEFFENLLGLKLNINKTFINTQKVNSNFSLPDDYVVIFPGAGARFRQWNTENYSRVIDYIVQIFNLYVVVAGSCRDKKLSKQIISGVKQKKVIDITGKTSLSQLALILSKSKLLISSDTGPYHIALATGTRVLCLSNGNTFGRFVPYPAEVSSNVFYVFSEEIQNNIQDFNFLNKNFRFASTLDINNIKVDDVCKLVSSILE